MHYLKGKRNFFGKAFRASHLLGATKTFCYQSSSVSVYFTSLNWKRTQSKQLFVQNVPNFVDPATLYYFASKHLQTPLLPVCIV